MKSGNPFKNKKNSKENIIINNSTYDEWSQSNESVYQIIKVVVFIELTHTDISCVETYVIGATTSIAWVYCALTGKFRDILNG